MNIILPIFILFLNTSAHPESGKDYATGKQDSLFLIKNHWHTGLVLRMDDVHKFIPELNEFSEYNYVDIGWGDEDFYQHPGFDAGLAVKALFYPTPSALRIEGFNLTIEQYINLSDMAILIEVDESQIKQISQHISAAFYRNKKDDPVKLLSTAYGGKIKFFKANGEYHLFNTCNTWVAEGLSAAGIEMNEHVILAEQLFNEAAKSGKVLK
jgi:uncharacterized protein (TIGR02117 family)